LRCGLAARGEQNEDADEHCEPSVSAPQCQFVSSRTFERAWKALAIEA
jgi:hypothetical protein